MVYSFASALPAVIDQRKHHTREAKRLQLAGNLTVPDARGEGLASWSKPKSTRCLPGYSAG